MSPKRTVRGETVTGYVPCCSSRTISYVLITTSIPSFPSMGKDRGRGDSSNRLPSTPIPAFPRQGERRPGTMRWFADIFNFCRRAKVHDILRGEKYFSNLLLGF